MNHSSPLASRLSIVLFVLCFAAGFSDVSQAQIVAFGASNVAGKGVFPDQAWPAQLEKLLKAKGYHLHVINAGLTGETTSHMLKRIDSAVPDGTRIVILDMAGGLFNNARSQIPPAQGEADMKNLEARIKSRGMTFVPETTSSVPATYRQSDRIHLTAQGHRLIAEQLLPKVVAALGAPPAG